LSLLLDEFGLGGSEVNQTLTFMAPRPRVTDESLLPYPLPGLQVRPWELP